MQWEHTTKIIFSFVLRTDVCLFFFFCDIVKQNQTKIDFKKSPKQTNKQEKKKPKKTKERNKEKKEEEGKEEIHCLPDKKIQHNFIIRRIIYQEDNSPKERIPCWKTRRF